MTEHNRAWAAVAAVVGAVTLAWWLPFSIEPPGRDQALFAAQGQALLDGAPLYTGIWEHKPPGVIVAYAAAQALFGRGFVAVHLLDALAGVATALLVAGLVWRHARNAAAAAAAGILYAAYHSGPAFGGFWCVAQAEVLMDPALAGALFALLGAREARKPERCYLLAGLLVAAAVGLKYSALPLALLPLPLLLDRSLDLRGRLRRGAAFVCGLAGPAVPAAIYLAATGRLAAFWTANVTFNRLHSSVATISRSANLARQVVFEFDLLLPLYLAAAAAIAAALLRRNAAGRARLPLLAGWTWLLALGGVFWQAKFWLYHYHVLLLPFALAAGCGIAAAASWLARAVPGKIVPAALLAAALALAAVPDARYTSAYVRAHRLVPALRGDIDRDAFFDTYRWGAPDYEALDTLRTARRIAAETGPRDRLFVWGFEPGLYVWSGRRPASRFFYDYPLMPRFESVHRAYVAQLMDDLRAHPPARVVVVRRDANDIEPRASVDQLADVPELAAWLEAGYEPSWIEGDFLVFRPRPAPPG